MLDLNIHVPLGFEFRILAFDRAFNKYKFIQWHERSHMYCTKQTKEAAYSSCRYAMKKSYVFPQKMVNEYPEWDGNAAFVPTEALQWSNRHASYERKIPAWNATLMVGGQPSSPPSNKKADNIISGYRQNTSRHYDAYDDDGGDDGYCSLYGGDFARMAGSNTNNAWNREKKPRDLQYHI